MLLLNPTIYTTAGVYALLVLCLVTAVFLLARLRNDNSVMDIFYGPIFALSYWGTWYLTGQPGDTSLIVGALVTLWATRLGIRIGRKKWGEAEDPRYAAWRNEWEQRGKIYFILRSYLQVNLLQGVVIVLVATPLWATLGLATIPLSWLVLLGIAITLAGLGYETLADWQLDRFIARKKAGLADATLMTQGLFRYSRRPNYFGESLVWWGLALIALSYGISTWFVLISPILITYILVKVTGPLLEQHFMNTYPEAYRHYQEKTPTFLVPKFW